MSRKLMTIWLFCLFFLEAFGASITATNYQSFIDNKIKFSENLSKGQIYRIANTKFSTKKYAGKILTISNIDVDKKGNLVLFLSETVKNDKKKVVKINTKTKEVTLENISILYSPKSVAKVSPKPISTKPSAEFYSNSVSQKNSFDGLLCIFLYGYLQKMQFEPNEIWK